MKQQITRKQWQELSLGEQRKFQETLGHGGFPTIGDMIEFLKEHCNDFKIEYEDSNVSWRIYGSRHEYKSSNPYGDTELCNALWEAVKEVLEKL